LNGKNSTVSRYLCCKPHSARPYLDLLTDVAEENPAGLLLSVLITEGFPGTRTPINEALQEAGLAPKTEAVMRHEELNVDLHHSTIPRLLLAEIPAVGPAAQQEALADLLTMVELNFRAWHMMLRYYVAGDLPFPHTWMSIPPKRFSSYSRSTGSQTRQPDPHIALHFLGDFVSCFIDAETNGRSVGLQLFHARSNPWELRNGVGGAGQVENRWEAVNLFERRDQSAKRQNSHQGATEFRGKQVVQGNRLREAGQDDALWAVTPSWIAQPMTFRSASQWIWAACSTSSSVPQP
jgi:hypothetical protein